MPQKKKKTTLLDDLHEVHRSCQDMIRTTGAISLLVKNEVLVKAGNEESIVDHLKILARDLEAMSKELAIIKDDIPGILNDKDPSHLMLGLSLGQRFQEWQLNFDRLLTPTEDLIRSLLDAVNSQPITEGTTHDR